MSPSPRSSSDIGIESHDEEQKWKLPRYNAAGYRVDHGCGRRPPPTADHGYMSTYYVSPHEQMHPVDKRVRETSQDTQPDEKNRMWLVISSDETKTSCIRSVGSCFRILAAFSWKMC